MEIWKFLLLLILAGVTHGLPARFVQDDCDNFDCPDMYAPVCGSDDNTYSNMCEMNMVNKKRMCWIGHYNMIMKVRDGPCHSSTTATTPAATSL